MYMAFDLPPHPSANADTFPSKGKAMIEGVMKEGFYGDKLHAEAVTCTAKAWI